MSDPDMARQIFLRHLSAIIWLIWFHIFQILFLNKNTNFKYFASTFEFFAEKFFWRFLLFLKSNKWKSSKTII